MLDFGLAKGFSSDGSDGSLSQSPTLSMAATQHGVILGTAAYMSPEQARGQEVDKRADIWAFGVVLFEMLTGRGTFDGGTVSDVLAAVIRGEPEWTSLPAGLHPRVRELLERCLEKEATNRWQAMGDVRIDIQKVVADPSGGIVQQVADVPVPTRFTRPWIGAAFVLVAGVAVVAAWNLKPVPPPASRPVTRFDYVLSEGQLPQNLRPPLFAVSADGSRFAYGTDAGVYLRSMDELVARVVPGTESEAVNQLFFSPDGVWIGYYSSLERQLKKVPVGGGIPVPLVEVDCPCDPVWTEDGSIVYRQDGKGIMSVSANGGDPHVLAPSEISLRSPAMLPGGQSLLHHIRDPNDPDPQIVGRSLESGQEQILFAGYMPSYLPTGHVVYAMGYDILARTFDSETWEFGGPVPLVQNVFSSFPPPNATLQWVVSAGSMVYLPGEEGQLGGASLVWVDREGTEEALSTEPGNYRLPALSPDRSMVTYFNFGSGSEDIWTYDIETGVRSQETFFAGVDQLPVWSPNGDRLSFTSERDGDDKDIFTKRMDPRGTPERLLLREGDQYASSWSPDGRTLAFYENKGPFDPRDIYTLSLDDGEVTPFVTTEADERGAMFSLDGKWIAYVSDEQGTTDIYVMPFPADPGGRVRISYGGGSEPRWGVDGKELFYRDGTSMMSVEIGLGPVPEPGPARELFPDSYRRGPTENLSDYDIDLDGSRFLMVKVNQATAPRQIRIVLNWSEELKERVPVP